MNIKNKHQIIENLLNAGNQCLLRFENRTELATENDKRVKYLYECFELFFFHGMKKTNCDSTKKIINNSLSNNLKNLNNYTNLTENSIEFWKFIYFFLNKHKQERFSKLKNITTVLGKCRSWIRSSLNERSLERYLQAIFEKESRIIKNFYFEEAALRDLEKRNEILNLVSKLKLVLFASSIDNPKLNNIYINLSQEQFDEKNNENLNVNQKQNEIEMICDNMSPPNNSKLNMILSFEKCNNYLSNQIQTNKEKNLNEKIDSETNEQIVENVLLTPIASDNYSINQFMFNFEDDDKISDISNQSCNTSCSSTPAQTKEFKNFEKSKIYLNNNESNQINNFSDNLVFSQTTEIKYNSKIENLDKSNCNLHELQKCNEELFKEIQIIKKENITLKKSLKKYIDAISLLKTNNRHDLTICTNNCKEIFLKESIEKDELLENQINIDTNAYLNYRDLVEYEKKLIQVAEMHGEIVEYNDCLQKIIMQKDARIKRLKDELIELRGPLPQSIQSSDETEIFTLENDTENLLFKYQSKPILIEKLKPLINVWIPSAFLVDQKQILNTYLITDQQLRNKKLSSHHVYQIYIRIKEEEWNVYRRYSQFYSIHQDLKKKYQKIGFLEFPPKKTIGNRHAKVVQERRKKLETYLRFALNILQTECSIYDKNSLIEVLPFLSEKYFLHDKAIKTTNIKTNLNESNPGETIVQKQDYTGL